MTKAGKVLAVLVVLIIAAGGVQVARLYQQEQTRLTLSWPTSGLGAMLPAPDAAKGEITDDDEDSFTARVYGMSEEQFADYKDACGDAGFSVDVDDVSDTWRKACNEDGYELDLSYDGDGGVHGSTLKIDVDAPRKTAAASSSTRADSSKADAAASKAQETVTEEPVTGEEAPAEEEAPAAEAEPVAEEEMPAAETQATVGDDAPVDGIRPSFKEALDSYEAFYDEYVEFMTTYTESGNPVSMLNDYMSMISQYSEMAEKMEALEEQEMSNEELAYFLEVQTRINEKLLAVTDDAS